MKQIGFRAFAIEDYVYVYIKSFTDFPDKVIEVIKNVLSSLDINEEDFKRKRKAQIASFVEDSDRVQPLVDYVSEEIVKFGDIIYNDYDMYKTISFDEVMEYKAKMKIAGTTISVINPEK